MGRSGPDRARRGVCLGLAALLGGLVAACAGPRPVPPPSAVVDPTYEPAFQALAAALEADDEQEAGRILERILARDPPEGTRALAEVYGRILRGRAIGRALELALVVVTAADGASCELSLSARHPFEGTLELHGGAGTLRQLLTGIDAAGTEQRVSRSLALESVAELRLPPGEAVQLELGRFEVPLSGALAVEADWDLRLPPGTVRWDAADYPVENLSVRGCESLRLAPFLPQALVEPDELARYVAAGGRSMPALVERAVRVELARRGEALDALSSVALALPRIDLAVLVPALRWLSGERRLGADVEAWALWLELRRAPRQPQEPAGPDLPQTGPGPGATVPVRGGKGP